MYLKCRSSCINYRDVAEDVYGVGRTSCNVAHAVGASHLHELETLAKFSQGPWKRRIAEAGQNPVVLGFLIERAVLGTLAQGGTLWAGEGFPDGALKVDRFHGPIPQAGTNRKKRPLYIYSHDLQI